MDCQKLNELQGVRGRTRDLSRPKGNGTMWYDVVQCGTMWHKRGQCGTMWYNVVQFGTINNEKKVVHTFNEIDNEE